uniref:PHD-type domain-containing protein n=1 Tax=Plectus sambesii TaxID=2011161 RepID=A0A914XNQ8_9BILA
MEKDDAQTSNEKDESLLNNSNLAKTKRKLPLELRKGEDCSLCGRGGSDNGELYGELYRFEYEEKRYAVHEICLMLAANLVVPNDQVDSSVLMGFRPKDILKEIRRGSSLACSVCRHRGATLGCQKCPLTFHMPCARDAGAFFDFSDCWTYCKLHWPSVEPERPLGGRKRLKTEMTLKGCLPMISDFNFPIITETECSLVCTEPIEPRPLLHKVVMTNCCQPLFTHFDCMQKYAAMMGSEMKCARCNISNDAFHKRLNKQGIYVSVRSAALDDLVDHTWRCIAADCKCPMGRAYFDKPNPRIFQSWEWINDCPTCESEIHRACAGPPWSLFDPNEDAEGEEALWICQGCSAIAGEAPPPSPEVRVRSPVTATSTSHLANVDLNIFDFNNETSGSPVSSPKKFGSYRESVATQTTGKRRSAKTAAPVSSKKKFLSTKITDLCKSSSEQAAQPSTPESTATADLLTRLNGLSGYRKRSANESPSPSFKKRKTNSIGKSPSQRGSGPLDRFLVKAPFGSDALATSSPRIRH